MSSSRVSHSAISVAPQTKASIVMLPLLYAVLPTYSAAAQVIPADSDTQSIVETTGSQIDITGGQKSRDGSNLFHGFEQFDIESGQTANFISVPEVQNVVGRIDAHQASVIDGTLQVSGSDANLYLMNPAGVLMGPDAHLNLGGSFSATTATGIEFGNEQLNFNSTNDYQALVGEPSAFRFENEQAGAVVNLGQLSVREGESIELMGGTVVNAGSLSAPEGTITVAAVEGGSIVRIQQNDQLLSLEVEASEQLLSGEHAIAPTSIGEMLTGGALSHGTALMKNADGSVQIAGSSRIITEGEGTAAVAGELFATGEQGGTVNVLGTRAALVGASIDVSGDYGGGLIRVGGDYKGEGRVFNATQTTVDANSQLSANALADGNGGRIIVWADDATTYDGHLSARGLGEGGDGGFAEVSGKIGLVVTGSVDLGAPDGQVGTVLFDPRNITITDSTPKPPSTGDSLFFSSSEIEDLSVSANVVLEANNDIFIGPISDGALTFASGRSVTFRADANERDGGQFSMSNNSDVIEVTDGNINIFGAGVTAGKLRIDVTYEENEANDPSLGNVLIESNKSIIIEEITSERGDVTLSADGIDVGIINTSTDDHNNGGGRVDGRSRIAAGNVMLNSSGNVIVGEILTYGLLTATDHHSPDGGNVTITAAEGGLNVTNTIQTFSYVDGHESGWAGDITLNAQNDISINTAGVNGTSLDASSGVHEYDVGNGGNISVETEQGSIYIQGGINTSAETEDGNGSGNAGQINLLASGDITTGQILSRAIAETRDPRDRSSNAGKGGIVVVDSANGDVQIERIESYSSANGNNAAGGGSVDISAVSVEIGVGGIDVSTRADRGAQSSGNITINAQDSVAIRGELESYSYARTGSNAGKGGDIFIEGNNITTELIEAWSLARDENASEGGNVTLRQHTESIGNSIVVNGDIQTYSFAGDDDAEDGGRIVIDVGSDLGTYVAVSGDIDTSSISRDDAAGNGGPVEIYADIIDISDINTDSKAYDDDAGNAGPVTLNGNHSLSVGSISALSSEANPGEIRLTGDSIALTGGDITGKFVRLSPFTASQNINIGLAGAAANSLNIDTSELSQIKSKIEFGNENRSGTGTVSLGESVITTVGSRPSIDILGGDRLTGPDLPAGEITYALEGAGSGRIVGADIRFFDIENLQGGAGTDIFRPNAGVDINDFDSISGGGGANILSYEQFVGEPLNIDLETIDINELKLVGPTANGTFSSTLQGRNEPNSWTISGPSTGQLNNNIEFENFDTIVGGSDRDTLDYSQYATAVSVDIEGRSTGLTGFSSIENIIGSSANSDQLIGSNSNDIFTIGETNRLNNIDFSSFERLDGSSGENTFEIDALTADLNVAGGSDLDNSQSNNRIILNSGNANWEISEKNKGSVEQLGSTLSFEEIQHIENDGTEGGEVNIFFASPFSQITGSISSGNSDLTIIGDDINLGHSNGTGDNQNASVSGSRTLTIRPASNSLGIELGGRDTFGRETLNITDGEIAAIEDGFIEITFGDRAMTGDISVIDDVNFQDSVSLLSQGNIDTTGGKVSLSEGDLTLNADASVTGSNISTANGDVTVLTRGNLQLNDIETVGSEGSGDIALTATNGGITAGKLLTSERSERGAAGGVNLSSTGNIEIEIIEAEGIGEDSGENRIEIDTLGTFKATDSLQGRSISTVGAGEGQGSIRISVGDAGSEAEQFTVGNRSALNHTSGTIFSGQTSISAGTYSDSNVQSDIAIINRGTTVQRRVEPTPVETLDAPAPPAPMERPRIPSVQLDSRSVVAVSLTASSDDDSVFSAIETTAGQEFSQYFSLSKTGEQTPPATLRQAQDKLSEVARTSGVTPALVYVYFVPDAASEPAVQAAPQTVSAQDELEVMVITADQQPIRHRQWGVTRAKVDEAAQALRRQTTSQFSTERQYLPPAQQLYDWVVAPIVSELQEQSVESLGFVMDTGLRTLPIAALHSGDRYLVEDYSLGILPTFSLTDFGNGAEDTDFAQGKNFREANVLAMGASEFEDQPDLPAVDEEVSLITQELWPGDAFLNEDFVLKNLQTQIAEQDYGVVHLATHANFKADDIDSSYIQMWDERLSLNEVSQLGLSNADIGLIILSACNTAVGDQNSEYGFAGFAVSAGAPSALASLWPVNDEGTLGFMSQFYTGLKESPTRAEALRQAQRSMISGDMGIEYGDIYGPDGEIIVRIPELEESGQWDFSHPFYWSAFTMIGNPW